ncbi:ATP-dependent sacrificial sulfur transferase LarE [soil metagenome]
MISEQQAPPTIPIETSAIAKEADLRAMMRSMRSVLVAYSGGVDSAYLSLIATQELADQALCITAHSPSVSRFQRTEAERIAKEFDFNFRVIETEEMNVPEYTANAGNRCYFCKSELYERLRAIAADEGIEHVIDGMNADDASDHRPGRVAAGEKGIRSPLSEAGMEKEDIRLLSRLQGLPTWDAPASPCLSSRLAYGTPVTIGRLSKVERGEAVLRELGFREFRVRLHSDMVRIEVAADEMQKMLDPSIVNAVKEKFRNIGFEFITLDLEGFRSGSLNRVLEQDRLERIN